MFLLSRLLYNAARRLADTSAVLEHSLLPATGGFLDAAAGLLMSNGPSSLAGQDSLVEAPSFLSGSNRRKKQVLSK